MTTKICTIQKSMVSTVLAQTKNSNLPCSLAELTILQCYITLTETARKTQKSQKHEGHSGNEKEKRNLLPDRLYSMEARLEFCSQSQTPWNLPSRTGTSRFEGSASPDGEWSGLVLPLTQPACPARRRRPSPCLGSAGPARREGCRNPPAPTS